MREIEGANPSLKDVLPKDYGLPSLDKRVLGQLIDMISDIEIGDRESRSKDVLGPRLRVFPVAVCECRG